MLFVILLLIDFNKLLLIDDFDYSPIESLSVYSFEFTIESFYISIESIY